MAVVTSAVVGGVGALAGGVASVKGAMSAADAADKAGKAQMQAAREQLADQKASRETALRIAAPSAAELAAIDRVVQRNEAALVTSMDQISKGLQLIDSIDPAIKEAGVQAYDLLKGKQAELLGPVAANRARQRKELEGQLSARLGPGFRTSSAGIEALNRFDTATSDSLAQTQQQSLLTLGNFFAGTSAARGGVVASMNDIMRTGQSGEQVALNALGQVANRQTTAWNGAAPTAGQAVIQAAGGQYAGQAAGANSMQQLGGAIGNLGAQGLGFAMGQMNKTEQFNNQLSALQNAGAFSNMGTAPSSFAGPNLGLNYDFTK